MTYPAPATLPVSANRRRWATPTVRRTSAGSAEAGANPVSPEGFAGFGS